MGKQLKKIKISQKVMMIFPNIILESFSIYSKATTIQNCVIQNNNYIIDNDDEDWECKIILLIILIVLLILAYAKVFEVQIYPYSDGSYDTLDFNANSMTGNNRIGGLLSIVSHSFSNPGDACDSSEIHAMIQENPITQNTKMGGVYKIECEYAHVLLYNNEISDNTVNEGMKPTVLSSIT
jgi:hypothetical protein